MSSKPLRFRVIPVEQGLTLRSLLIRRMRDLDRESCAELIRRGGVYVNRLRIRLPQVVVAPGERITVYREALAAEPLDPAKLVFVHRERDFVVVDKPAGVPVAAVRETAVGCLSEALVSQLEREGVKRPYVGVVHRLDRGASGLVLFTIRSVANKSLHQQFREHRMGRRYRLRTFQLDAEREVPESITIDTPLVRLRGGGVQLGTAGGQDAIPAVTHLSHVARLELGEGQIEHLWDARLETGRTHQIRAHVASIGFPIVGDHRYGPGGRLGDEDDEDEQDPHGRLLLHAWMLDLEHPSSGAPLHFETPLPEWGSPT
ncbi:pseudouridine synthase [Nannocystaceae bacterium ST9]